MEAKLIAAIPIVVAMSAVGPPIAHADPFYQFQSPSGDITCVMSALQGDRPPSVLWRY